MHATELQIYPEKPALDDDIVVLHSGFCSVKPNFSTGRDVRDYYMIHYCTSGRGKYIVSDHVYDITEKNGFLSTPNTHYNHTADANDPWDLCWVAFFGRKADAYLAQANLNKDNLIFRYDKDDFPETCIRNIYNESRGRRNIAMITGHFMLFLGCLIDHHQSASGRPDTPLIAFSHFESAVNYISKHIHMRVSIEELSDYLMLDSSQIYRIFKEKTGIPPLQFITKMRMEKACGMLLQTDLPIKDVSDWLNYDYPSHFTKQFKNYVGMTPQAYRARNSSRR